MKTKKNKIIKGIKILSKGKALYYAVLVSAGSGCEKKSTQIQSAKNLTCTQDSRGSNKNHGPISTIDQPNQRNVTPGGQKNRCDGNKVTDPDSKFKDGRLDNVEKKDSMQQNSEQKSPNLEPPIQNIPVDLLLQTLGEKIDELKKLKKEKLSKKAKVSEDDIKKIETFCKENSVENIQNPIKNKPKEDRAEYIQIILRLANAYIKALEKL